ncbi:head closure Hc1 [Arthrobacter phage Liebe]|uniref:Head-to-tail stopper n=2 Tax=Arthrobacter virus Liebe TaxID=2734245 RepID=A0A3G2KHP9_9CAUD|nr:head closure Hc1 [Arthrobacter phage Liebe]AYN58490.1 head-to-tail stopper [Arthrobacter phage Maureen]AZF93742.1 head-to-tail stopper [Arthrobacter phage Liebe]
MLLSPDPTVPPVYRLRAGTTTDSYGDPVESWDAPDRVRLRGASVQDVTVAEGEGVARRVIRREWTLFAPGAVDLTADDRVEYEGDVWRVDGDPATKRGLGSAVYTVCALTRVTTR